MIRIMFSEAFGQSFAGMTNVESVFRPRKKYVEITGHK
ncbi:hypothetical protein AO498_16457 [Algoriphagus sanaruensis]|uniref:Uncharacterized protein n=1 Tax=Algoriphagus sanaruensis TaxID=1727163 RepID=A0A142ESE1_9BACT|nr:hypothetical protein AO498_16457 [Algoriphagus sanaruensis]